jgi:glucose/arabinose dehydrogenase
MHPPGLFGKGSPVPHPYRAAAFVVALAATPAPAQIALTQVGTGFNQPLFLAAAPGDVNPNNLYVVEKNGTVRTLNASGGVGTPGTTFLNLPATGESMLTASEQGLLGMAFGPGFSNGNGFVYVDYTGNNGTTQGETRVDRFTVAGGSIVAGSRQRVLSFARNVAGQGNHNGGWIGFGPDNLLYVSTGDGGSSNDPMQNAQNRTVLLGKMLRINPTGPDALPADANNNYAIPTNNPFFGNTSGFRQEIYAYGLRNPFRASFDRGTGNLYIGDVGQNTREEVDFIPAGSNGGQNFGWRKYEGNGLNPGVLDTLPNAIDVVFPIYDYGRQNGDATVTGGYVYRGGDILDHGQSLDGTYIFGDYISGRIFSVRYSGTGAVGTVTDRSPETNSIAVLGGSSLDSFGEDNLGRLYAIDIGGQIYRITGTPVPEPGMLPLVAAAAGGWLWRRSGRGKLNPCTRTTT